MKTDSIVRRPAVFAAAFAIATGFFIAPAVAGDASQTCVGPTCSGPCAAVSDPGEQQRLGELVTHQRDELVNLSRALTVEQRRQSELEAQLAEARVASPPAKEPAPAPSVNVTSLEEENRRLRTQLDAERESNQKLEAKLRTASHVADLVFRSSSTETAPPAPRGEEPSAIVAAPKSTQADDGTAWPFPGK